MVHHIYLIAALFFIIPKSCNQGGKKTTINQETVSSLISDLCEDLSSPDSIGRIRQMVWMAYATPEIFDSIHRQHLDDYYGSAIVTESNGSKRIVVFGATDEKDAYGDDDLAYLRSVLENFLSINGIIAYGDDIPGIEAAMYNLQRTKHIPMPPFEDSDTWESYITKVAEHLKQFDLCLLREINGANFIVLPCKKINAIIQKMKEIDWHWQQMKLPGGSE